MAQITLYLIFALAPSIIWLLFFLRKDVHPESNRMIIQVFLLGMAVAPIVALVECVPTNLKPLNCLFPSVLFKTFPHPLSLILYLFLGVAFLEEVAKYLVVKLKVINDPEFDEPVDAMLYMIIAALGFAAFENLLIFLSPKIFFLTMGKTIALAGFRFISATFLHALCSGMLGFFLALGFFETKRRGIFLASGLSLAIILHGLYNFSIIKIGELIIVRDGLTVITNLGLFISFIIILITILIGLAIFVLLGLRRLRKLASICKIK